MQRRPFQKKKFLALPKRRQYKKIRERLEGLLESLFSKKDTNDALEDMHELLSLLSFLESTEEDEPSLRILHKSLMILLQDKDLFSDLSDSEKSASHVSALHESSLRGLYESYLLLSHQIGLGPRADLLRLLEKPEASFANKGNRSQLPFRFCLWNLRSAHNAGSILRSLDCFGFEGLILAGYTPGPESKGFRAASMHTESWMEIERIAADFLELKKCLRPKQKLLALETHPSAIPLRDFSFPKAGGIVLAGNEELGLPKDLLDKVDACLCIPMYGKKASLNVSNACAVLAYAVRENENTQTFA